MFCGLVGTFIVAGVSVIVTGVAVAMYKDKKKRDEYSVLDGFNDKNGLYSSI